MAASSSNSIYIDALRETVSTVSVPAVLLPRLFRLTRKRRFSRRKLLTFLLWRHGSALAQITPGVNVKRFYQKQGLKLQRLDFRPNNGDWLELGLLACSLGLSRCAVFVMLLQRELSMSSGESSGVGTPVRKRPAILSFSVFTVIDSFHRSGKLWHRRTRWR